jgi:hypothetical protein
MARKGRLTSSITDAWEDDWWSDRNNPRKLFRWAFGVYTVSQTTPDSKFKSVPDLTRTPVRDLPACYEFARMYFLSQAKLYGYPDLKPLGARLLKHTPNDWSVTYEYASCYSHLEKTAERSKTIDGIRALMKEYPSKPDLHIMLGTVYYSSWYFYHDPADLKTAIAEYKSYVAAAPETDPHRAYMQRFTAMREAELAGLK